MGNCYNTVEINVPVAKVWKTICNFHDMTWAPGIITDLKKIGDISGDQVGAQRVLNDTFHETLTELDAKAHSFAYSMDEGPGPVSSSSVSNYVGKVRVTPAGDGTLVEWSSSFDSATEHEVAEFCNPIYTALLSALKETLS